MSDISDYQEPDERAASPAAEATSSSQLETIRNPQAFEPGEDDPFLDMQEHRSSSSRSTLNAPPKSNGRPGPGDTANPETSFSNNDSSRRPPSPGSAGSSGSRFDSSELDVQPNHERGHEHTDEVADKPVDQPTDELNTRSPSPAQPPNDPPEQPSSEPGDEHTDQPTDTTQVNQTPKPKPDPGKRRADGERRQDNSSSPTGTIGVVVIAADDTAIMCRPERIMVAFPVTWRKNAGEGNVLLSERKIYLSRKFMTVETFKMVLHLALGLKHKAMAPLLSHSWKTWRPFLLNVLEFLSYEDSATGLANLQAYIAEAALSRRMSLDSALMAACLMNSPTLVESLIWQSGQFFWAPFEGKTDRGPAQRALFLVSAAPKEFAKALPFQYYWSLNYVAQFAHPVEDPGRFAKEFWSALLQFWDDDNSNTSMTLEAEPESSDSESDESVADDSLEAKLHCFPKLICAKPVPEPTVDLRPPLSRYDTALGPTIMSQGLEFRAMRNVGSIPQQTIPFLQEVGGPERRNAGVQTTITQPNRGGKEEKQPEEDSDLPPEAEEVDQLDPFNGSPSPQPRTRSRGGGTKRLREETEDESENGDPNSDGDECKDESHSIKRRRETTAALEGSRRSGRLRAKAETASSAPAPEAPPVPPKRGVKAQPKAPTSKSTSSRKRKATESEPPEEGGSSPPKQRKKNAPKAAAVPKATKRRGKK